MIWLASLLQYFFLFLLKIFFIYFESELKGEREGEKHWHVRDTSVHCLLYTPGDLTCNPDICPDWNSNQQPLGSQAGAHSTKPHQPGPYPNILITFNLSSFSFSIYLAPSTYFTFIYTFFFFFFFFLFIVCFPLLEWSSKRTEVFVFYSLMGT